MIKIVETRLSAIEIRTYFIENASLFKPSLDSRVDLNGFSEKLHHHAIHFCVFDDDRLVGLAACYFNDPCSNEAYLSSFSISDRYQNRGLAPELLGYIRDYGLEKKFRRIVLKVHILNQAALKVYSKFGFIGSTEISEGYQKMYLPIS